MKFLILLMLLVVCDEKALPARDGKCQEAEITVYRGKNDGTPMGNDGGMRCAYKGFWWLCNVDGLSCRREAAIPAEAK